MAEARIGDEVIGRAGAKDPAMVIAKPAVIPAVAEQVFDEFWVSSMQIFATDPNVPVRITCQITAVNTDENARKNKGPSRFFSIEDFYGTASREELEAIANFLKMLKTRFDLDNAFAPQEEKPVMPEVIE